MRVHGREFGDIQSQSTAQTPYNTNKAQLVTHPYNRNAKFLHMNLAGTKKTNESQFSPGFSF